MQVFAKLWASPGHYPTITDLARALGESAEALAEFVTKEDTTYAEIVDEIKLKLASNYFIKTTLSFDDIASRLDFKDEDEFK